MDEFPKALLTAVGSRYRFERLLGEGGMGRVYVARDLKHDRRVAIKTIQPEFTSDAARKRFGREIKVTARLQHPHILPLIDSGVVGDLLYYVMPFVEGESLRERLDREKQLPIPDALQIAREVADALECAHEHEIVHRDIKPANILLSGGHVLVMDFGIARAASKTVGVTLTGTGMSIGTPLYMSPEQATDASAADARSDIYSLGCVLYEMLAGQPPFTGPTVENIIHQHLAVPPPPITNYRPLVPADVPPIFDRALAKSQADRFRRAGELSDALAAAGRRDVAPAAGARGLNPLVAVGVYLIGGWAALQIVERLAETAGLPEWVVPFALVLLLIGLPVIGVTAIIQWKAGRASAAAATGITPAGATTPRPGRRRRTGAPPAPAASKSPARLFTWRNAIAGGVMALALWGLVAVGWLIGFRDGPADSSVSSTRLESAEPPGASPLAGASVADAPVASDSDLAAAPAEEPRPGPVPSAVTDPGTDPDRPARRAGPDPEATAAARDRERAESARDAAERSGAPSLRLSSFARADSLRAAGVRAEAQGRHGDASRAFVTAQSAYRDAAEEARTTWSTRLDSAWKKVDSLRQRADRASAPFADAEGLRDEATRLEAGEEYAEAFATLERAGRTYARALPAVELPPPAGDPVAAEPEEPPPTAEERIRAAMDRLERAHESEDLAALQRVWVNLSADDVRDFRESFERLRDIDYQYRLDPESIRVSGEAIDFVVQVRLLFRIASTGAEDSLDELDAFRLIATEAGDVLRSR